jgi:DNA polymerase-3 subunit beta
MKFTANRAALTEELAACLGVIFKSPTGIAILAHVLIETDGDRIKLTATDIERALTTSCEAMVTEPGATTIDAKRLRDVLTNITGETVRIELDDKRVTIRGAAERIELEHLDAGDFPARADDGDAAAVCETETAALTTIIADASYAADSDRTTMQGVYLIKERKRIQAIATDGKRLSHAAVEDSSGADAVTLFLPLAGARAASKLMESGVTRVSATDNFILFESGMRTLAVRRADSIAPNFAGAMSQTWSRKIMLDRLVVLRTLAAASLAAIGDFRVVKLSFGLDKLSMSSQAADATAEASMLAEYAGEPFDIEIVVSHLRDLAEHMTGKQLLAEFGEKPQNFAMRWTSPDSPLDRTAIVMPIWKG